MNGILGLVIHGYSQVTTQALHLCTSHGIPIHWLTPGGRYAAGLAVNSGPVQRRIRQYRALTDPNICLRLARRATQAKVENQLRFLLRSTRGEPGRSSTVLGSLGVIRDALHSIQRATSLEVLRGVEGNAARAYFTAIPELLLPTTPQDLYPSGRAAARRGTRSTRS